MSSTKRKTPRNQSLVWRFFIEVTHEEKIMKKCIKCSKLYSKGTSNSTLYTHLANVHMINLNANNDNSQDESEDDMEIPSNQEVSSSGRKHGKLSQKRIDENFLKFLVTDMQAFNLCESPSFRVFTESLDSKWQMPNSHTIRERINTRFDHEKELVKKLARFADCKFSFTTDGWDSISVDPYLGLTCHFIDDDWILREFLLDFTYSPRPHTSCNLKETIIEVNKY